MSSQPPSGFIHLVLLSQEDPFYLKIPTAIVATVCLLISPWKYLQYLGWCVLGVIGVLVNEQGKEIALNGELVDQGIYHYIVPDQDVLAHAIDLKVIKQWSEVSSKSTETLQIHKDFPTRVLECNGHCMWTGVCGMGMYIIPHTWGNKAHSHYSRPDMQAKFSILLQWLQLLHAVPELTGPGVRVGRVRSSGGRGFSEWVAAPTRLSCPGFSRG